GTDDGRIRRKVRDRLQVNASSMRRRHRAKNKLGLLHHFAEIGGWLHAGGNRNSRKVGGIFPMIPDGLGDRRLSNPKPDFMFGTAVPQHHGKSGSPASAAQNGDSAHAASPFDLPRRYLGSVPSTNRCKFALCL